MKKLIAFLFAISFAVPAYAFDTKVTLSWNDPGSEEAFVLERSNTACSAAVTASWSAVANIAANTLTYEDTVQDNATYCYRIRAVKGGIQGPVSNTWEAIVPPSLAPITLTGTIQP